MKRGEQLLKQKQEAMSEYNDFARNTG